MKKKILVALFGVVVLMTSACAVEAVLTSAEVGIRLAKAVKEARTQHPDEFAKRAQFYANLYCELRVDYKLTWDDVRGKALDHGAPEWAVTAVQELVNKECGA